MRPMIRVRNGIENVMERLVIRRRIMVERMVMVRLVT